MKCEECLPLIEEYVDKELGTSASERIAAHLSTCPTCALEATELERELEIYARYQRDIVVTPAQWNIVRARIEQEKEQPNGEPRARFREWLSGLFGRGKRFRPALALALLLIFIGVTAAIIYNARHRGSAELASQPQQREDAVASQQVSPQEKRAPEKINDDNQTVARDGNEKNSQRQTVRDNTAGISRQKRTDLAVNSRQPALQQTPQQIKRAPNENAPRFEEAVANSSDVMRGERVPAMDGDFDFEIARHAEKAELLLRSFRNARPLATNHALDVSYEREDARKLLYQNISLRRDAEARGDHSSATLLNTLEPILLDIAHLPEKARARDVHSIADRMQKKEIVAALQVRALVASN
jgi:anti-sigma factor RsiW